MGAYLDALRFYGNLAHHAREQPGWGDAGRRTTYVVSILAMMVMSHLTVYFSLFLPPFFLATENFRVHVHVEIAIPDITLA